ncbi:MAG: glycerophosphodiester phosphodiesterase [Ignavibacteriales bacterium]|nr:glycerophosphodiester phosphodiesterase [Ignavibacteriales bacterium]
MLSWSELPQHPIIIAHRGASATAPENTLTAFSQAIECGVNAIELDVRLTNDNRVVVIHDSHLRRTTNGKGNVHESSLSELKMYSAGSWFHKKYTDERIPTLTEVIELVHGRVGINIELKHEGSRREGNILVEQTVKIVEQYRAEQLVMFSSFNHALVQYAKILNKNIIRGILFHTYCVPFYSPPKKLKEISASFLICNKHLLRKRLIDVAHQHNIQTGIYTINTEESLTKALRYGVDCIFTDDPKTILTCLKHSFR